MPSCLDCGTPLTGHGAPVRCRSCASRVRPRGEAPSGENHWAWKGDAVDPGPALHMWMRKHLPAPALCQRCGVKPPYDLANQGTYDRNPENWRWWCRRCHMQDDGRLARLSATMMGNKNALGHTYTPSAETRANISARMMGNKFGSKK